MDAQVALGNMCAEEGDLDEAQKWYEIACSGPAPHVDAMFNLASMQYDAVAGTSESVCQHGCSQMKLDY